MTITEQIRKNTAVQAVVGAGDLVVERLRHADVQQRVDALVAELRELPEQLRGLPDKAQAAAAETLTTALNQALATYGDLAERGEHLVDRIRNQQSTQQTAAQARTTTAQAKGAATTARKQAAGTTTTTKRSAAQTRGSAKKTSGSAKRTAKTATKSAKKSSAQTRSRAKATGTSARKTAKSAAKATTDAAKKVGD